MVLLPVIPAGREFAGEPGSIDGLQAPCRGAWCDRRVPAHLELVAAPSRGRPLAAPGRASAGWLRVAPGKQSGQQARFDRLVGLEAGGAERLARCLGEGGCGGEPNQFAAADLDAAS